MFSQALEYRQDKSVYFEIFSILKSF